MNTESIIMIICGLTVAGLGVYELIHGATLPRGRFKLVSYTRTENPFRYWWSVFWEILIGLGLTLYGLFGTEIFSILGL